LIRKEEKISRGKKRGTRSSNDLQAGAEIGTVFLDSFSLDDIPDGLWAPQTAVIFLQCPDLGSPGIS
jgi:hypothetical protein